MKAKLFQNKIVVKKSKLHGYGVFAGKNLKKGEKIEDCYFLMTRKANDAFEDFYFDAEGKYAFLTGFGSIYNHADEPNADYDIDVKNRVATFFTEKPIKKGEEIFVSYGDDWFETRGLKPKNLQTKKRKKAKKAKKKKRKN